MFNQGCRKLYGVSSKDLVDKACWKLSEFKNSMDANVKTGKPIAYGELASKKERMTLPNQSGKKVWVETI